MHDESVPFMAHCDDFDNYKITFLKVLKLIHFFNLNLQLSKAYPTIKASLFNTKIKDFWINFKLLMLIEYPIAEVITFLALFDSTGQQHLKKK